MRILYLSYSYWPPDFGGELLISIERFRSLAGRGHRVEVFTSGRPGLPARSDDAGIEISRSPVVHNSRAGRLVRRLVFGLLGLVRAATGNYDVLHLAELGGFEPISAALVTWAAAGIARARGKAVIAVHSLADREDCPFDRGKGIWRLLRDLYFANIRTIVAVSPALYEGVRAAYPPKAIYLPYGIRDDIFHPIAAETRKAIRAEMGLGEDEVVFAFLGSVTRRKGFDLLAGVFRDRSACHPGWRLWVFGPGSKKDNQNITDAEVEEITAALAGLDGKVRFWGRMDDRRRLAKHLAACDVFVFPTRKEGMPIAPMEAMAAGLPVILSKIHNVTDLAVEEGESGLYIQPGDREGLAAAMERLGSDRGCRARMGKCAAVQVRQKFSWEDHVSRWERLYREGCHGK